jgi:hypothetical protein
MRLLMGLYLSLTQIVRKIYYGNVIKQEKITENIELLLRNRYFIGISHQLSVRFFFFFLRGRFPVTRRRRVEFCRRCCFLHMRSNQKVLILLAF